MNPVSLFGGVLLGLGSALHCAGMCGGIAASLVMGLSGQASLKSRLEVVVSAHAGKTLAYVAAGMILGGLGSGLYGILNREAAYLVLQRVGAAGIGWVGLSFLGVVPPMRWLDRYLAPVRVALLRRRATAPKLTAALAGLGWGLMPCGIAYSALFYAMLSGSALSGGLVMLGFGLGVAPAVAASALGIAWLPDLAQRVWAQRLVGGAMIALAAATLVWPMGLAAALCAPR